MFVRLELFLPFLNCFRFVLSSIGSVMQSDIKSN